MEIERKFLVDGEYKKDASSAVRIIQGYLSSVPERTVRVRISGDRGFITVKGISSKSGLSRLEWEKEILLNDAEVLLSLCEPGVIDKVRHFVKYGGHIFEVDEFHGENEGLTLAEIELSSENEEFARPDWLAKEVTADSRYYNSYLSLYPYRLWKK